MKKIAILMFVFLCLSADLKVTVFPYIHWVSWLILVLPFMTADFINKGFVVSPFLHLTLFVFMLGCMTSLFIEPNLETVIQIIKFTVIFVTLYYFLFYKSFELESIVHIFNLAVILNSVFLIIGVMNIFPVAYLLTSDGRWGTILAYPGTLVKIGAIGVYINLMAVFMNFKRKKLVPIIMLILGLFIIVMDGSRTGMLVIIFTSIIFPILYFVVNIKDKTRAVFIPFIFSLIFFMILILLSPLIIESRIGESLLKFYNVSSLSEALKSIDPTRYDMILAAFDKISSSPFLGSGAFSTVATEGTAKGMVVHNSYLQVWGDFGFFGLISIIFLYLGWIFMLPRVFKKLQIIGNSSVSSIICSAILLLVYFILNGLFHPYSTEFSEWITFIIPLTIIYQFYRDDNSQNNEKLIVGN